MSVQFGAAVSKDQFDQIPPVGMVMLRLVTSSLILLAIARPRLGGRTVRDWRPVLALGLALGAMNWAFYESFARIPLGVALTIEFIGPCTIAAIGTRRPRDLVCGPGRTGHRHLRCRTHEGRRPRIRTGVARGRLLGGLHPLDSGDRTPLGGRGRSGDGQHGRHPRHRTVRRGDRGLAPARATAARVGGAGRPAQLGGPVWPRDDRPAFPAAAGVRHLDEPRTGCGGVGGSPAPSGVAVPTAVARDRLCHSGQRRRLPYDVGPRRRPSRLTSCRVSAHLAWATPSVKDELTLASALL